MPSCRSGKLAGLARGPDQRSHRDDSAAKSQALIDGFATGETVRSRRGAAAEIDVWFAHDRMEDIVAALQRDGSELAQATLKTLNEKSPRGMVVALKLLRLARGFVLAGRMSGAGISRRT